MSEVTGPDRLFIAFLEEWNERHPEGWALDDELQEMISRYINWARVISAECVINRLTRCIELTPRNDGKLNYRAVIELIRTIDPTDTSQLITPLKRDYRFKNLIERTLKPEL